MIKLLKDFYVEQLFAPGKPIYWNIASSIVNGLLFLNPMFFFFLIAPQLVCIVTDNLSTTSVYQLGSPLSRCLTHIDHLYWERTTYYFLPMKTQVFKKKKKERKKTQVLWPQILFPYVVCF